MNYEHHIFISYARGSVWTHWVRDIFVLKLQSYLELEIGHVEVFVDDQIQTGARWEQVLKRKIACSKLMLPLMSANYFQREWCRREMALMLEREQNLGLIGNDDNYGLLIPVRLGDGQSFPTIVGRVQYQDFEKYADPDLPAGSLRATEFNDLLRQLAKTIARTLPRVPLDCCDSWLELTGDPFLRQLEAKPLPAHAPPRLIV